MKRQSSVVMSLIIPNFYFTSPKKAILSISVDKEDATLLKRLRIKRMRAEGELDNSEEIINAV